MIKFSEISKKKIKEFAGEVIFNRGDEYYHDELVEDFEYDPDQHIFSATVQGSIGYYSVEVWNNNDIIEANCDCPYDGYPCKHIVAVLLYFLNNKEKYLKGLAAQQEIEKVVKDKLFSFSKTELIEILLSYFKKYPSFRRELMLQLSVNKQSSINQFSKEIDKIFKIFENRNFSTYDISHKLEEILKQIETAGYEEKIEIIWKIADGVLHQLNEYGMDDIPLENIAIETMDLLVQLFDSHPEYLQRRIEIQAELEEYCECGNCGIVDHIYDTVRELSVENE